MTTLDFTSIAVCSLDADGAVARAADFSPLLTPSPRRLERDGARAALDL